MAIFNKSANNTNRQSSIVATGAQINGDLSLTSMIYVDGQIQGSINSTDSVIIGKNGCIKVDVISKRVVINGRLEGNVDADLVEILKDAVFEGDMNVADLVCEPGGRLIGSCSYKEQKNKINELSGIKLEYLPNSK